MANEEKHYTAAFKKEVAQKALDQDKKNLDSLSEQYEVPVSVILMWATELEKGGDSVFDTSEEPEPYPAEEIHNEVDLEVTDNNIADSIDHGVMFDRLNYKRLIFWSVFGVVLFAIIVQALIEMNQYNYQVAQQRVSSESEYYEVNQLKDEARQQLGSFGVVNLENGIYRIPIDSAISEIAADTE